MRLSKVLPFVYPGTISQKLPFGGCTKWSSHDQELQPAPVYMEVYVCTLTHFSAKVRISCHLYCTCRARCMLSTNALLRIPFFVTVSFTSLSHRPLLFNYLFLVLGGIVG